MTTRRTLRTALLGATLMLMSACGFHLRSDPAIPQTLQPLYIGGDAAFGLLGQQLRIQLLNDSVEITRDPAAAAYQLIVLDQYSDQRTASIDQRGRVAESALFMGASFELRDAQGKTAYGPVRVEERRTIINNPDNVSSTSEETRLTRQEMIEALAARILRRAGAYTPQPPGADARAGAGAG